MSKYEKTVVGLLIAIAVSGTVTAVEVVRLVEQGLNVEMTLEEAEELAKNVNEAVAAQEVAEGDMAKEASEASE